MRLLRITNKVSSESGISAVSVDGIRPPTCDFGLAGFRLVWAIVRASGWEKVMVVEKDSTRLFCGKRSRDPVVFTSAINGMEDDSPWDADPNPSYSHQSEWSKITSDFTNVRQRDQLKTRNLNFNYQGRLSGGHNRGEGIDSSSRLRRWVRSSRCPPRSRDGITTRNSPGPHNIHRFPAAAPTRKNPERSPGRNTNHLSSTLRHPIL